VRAPRIRTGAPKPSQAPRDIARLIRGGEGHLPAASASAPSSVSNR
jgi:hypothetical protein